MDLHEFQRCLDTARIGRVLLELAIPHLEVFPGNALYCERGMPTMKKYKTVKEVCALTGLTGKHLYYFHHAKVVRAAAYANYSVEGYSGYKLYDDAAVEKLQQIALYYQLGLKRNEIRDIMLDPKYDSNRILETLLQLEQDKKIHTERRIAALEHLILIGTKNGAIGSLQGISLDDLGRTLLTLREESVGENAIRVINQDEVDIFIKELANLVCELSRLDNDAIKEPVGTDTIRKIFELGSKYIGDDGCPFILGLFISSLGEGSVVRKISNQLTTFHIKAVVRYMIDHPEMYSRSSHEPCAESVEINRRNGK